VLEGDSGIQMLSWLEMREVEEGAVAIGGGGGWEQRMLLPLTTFKISSLLRNETISCLSSSSTKSTATITIVNRSYICNIAIMCNLLKQLSGQIIL